MVGTALKIYGMENGLGQCTEVICTEGIIFGTSQMGWEMGWGEGRMKTHSSGSKFSDLKKETKKMLFLRYWEVSDSLIIIMEDRNREDKDGMFRRT